MSPLEISVVMPTYNRIDTLREVLPTLLDQTLSADAYEIVVADSQSSDGTAEYVRDMCLREQERVRYVPGAYTGRGAARNAGIEAARAPVLLFTDAALLSSP